MPHLTERTIQDRIKALPAHARSCQECRDKLNAVSPRERKTSALVLQALAMKAAVDSGDVNSARTLADTLYGGLLHEQDFLRHLKERRAVLYPPCRTNPESARVVHTTPIALPNCAASARQA
jgi:hypothetical protein